MFVKNYKEEMKQAYISKHNFNLENKVIPFTIKDGEKRHYLAVKNLSALLRRITLKYDGNYYCINCLHSFRTENKHKAHENVRKNRDYCYVGMTEKGKNILKHNH